MLRLRISTGPAAFNFERNTGLPNFNSPKMSVSSTFTDKHAQKPKYSYYIETLCAETVPDVAEKHTSISRVLPANIPKVLAQFLRRQPVLQCSH